MTTNKNTSKLTYSIASLVIAAILYVLFLLNINGFLMMLLWAMLFVLPVACIIKSEGRKELIILYVNFLLSTLTWGFFYAVHTEPETYLYAFIPTCIFWKEAMGRQSDGSLFAAEMLTSVLMLFSTYKSWNLSEYILTFLFICFSYKFIARLVGCNLTLIIFSLSFYALRIANYYFAGFRYNFIGIQDILEIKTFLGVAKGYHFLFGMFVPVLLIYVLIRLISLLLIRKEKPPLPNRKWLSCGVCSCILFLILGFSTKTDTETGQSFNMTTLTSLSASITNQIKLKLMQPDMSRKEELDNFASDSATNDMPNIILILGESIADTANTFNVSYDDDPFEIFEKIDTGCNDVIKGDFSVTCYGGGTSVSEWKAITGLDSLKLGINSSPMFLAKGAYSYVNDDLYELPLPCGVSYGNGI